MITSVGDLIGKTWIDMLFDKNRPPTMRKQALHNSILADMKEDKYFVPFEGNVLRVGERRWTLNRRESNS